MNGEMIMDNKKKKRRTVGIILMWIGGVLTALTFVGVLVLSCVPGLFVGIIPLLLFFAGLIVFLMNKEKSLLITKCFECINSSILE